MLHTLPTPTDIKMISAREERPIAEWQQLYPDRWLLLEVTQEDEGEPMSGRLVAVAPHDMSLVPLWREQCQQGKITALVYGDSTEAGPSVVACNASSLGRLSGKQSARGVGETRTAPISGID